MNYKVKDMSLAEWGRKEILLAEAEMLPPIEIYSQPAYHIDEHILVYCGEDTY
jgi:S-adenosylhomocysteine hydrolase